LEAGRTSRSHRRNPADRLSGVKRRQAFRNRAAWATNSSGYWFCGPWLESG
jgi:hypothetical protein